MRAKLERFEPGRARAGIASAYDYVAAYPPGRDIAPCLPTKPDELRRDTGTSRRP